MLTRPMMLEKFHRILAIFAMRKASVEFKSTLAFAASHEARRRMAVFPIQLTRKPHQTGEPWHLSCHGGKTPANLLSLVCPAPYGRGVGCRGSAPAVICRGKATFA